jgi:RHS repeat-associated protein
VTNLYAFQGQENDDEIKGEGNSVNYKYRMHDPRLGRFFAIDPIAAEYPHNSPYAFSENRVIDGVELEGLEVGLVVGVSARLTGILSISSSADIIFYVDGLLNDDPLAFKIIFATTQAEGFGFLGMSVDAHVGIWIGNDENITGTSVLVGIEGALEGGASLELGISEPQGGFDGNLPSGIMLNVGFNGGAALNAYGEYANTQSAAGLVVNNDGVNFPLFESFFNELYKYFNEPTNNAAGLEQSMGELCSCNLSNGFGLINAAPAIESLKNNWLEIRQQITEKTGMSLPANLSSYFESFSNISTEETEKTVPFNESIETYTFGQ